MIKILTIILLSFVCFSANAQTSSAEISGRIVDSESNPVMYASIALFSGDKVVTGAMSDTTGFFLIKAKASGECTIKVSSIGYEDISRSVNVKAESKIDIGTIVIRQNTIALNSALVSAKQASKSVSIERTRINPEQSVSASTGSVLEVIRSSSSVNVDGSDNVSIRGNSNVLILVDGVPTTLGGLGSIPAANVQSIDIVTSPDVKYDSEGTGGIISIVSKKQVANSFSSMAAFNYGFNGFVNGNFAMSYNKGRWGIRANCNGRYEKDLIESEMHRQIKSTGNTLDQMISATKKNAYYNAGLNLNFKATKNDILTLDFKAIFPRMNNFQNFNNHYVNEGVPGDIFRQTDITFNRETFESSLGYKHVFDPGRKELNLTYAISKITGHRPSYYYEETQMVQKSVSGGHPFNTSFQADYLSALGKGKFEAGVKMTYRHNDIDHKMYELIPETGGWEFSIPLSNDLVHSEYIPAAYAMYSSKLSEKLSYKAGLRLEYSHVTLHSEKEELDAHSDCFFAAPNIMFNYGISEKWAMNLGFSRRISRPTYPQLNPYINLIDRQTYETGNMNLQPEKANKLDLVFISLQNTENRRECLSQLHHRIHHPSLHSEGQYPYNVICQWRYGHAGRNRPQYQY